MGEIRFRSKKDKKVKFVADADGKIWQTDKKGVKDKLISEPPKKDEDKDGK